MRLRLSFLLALTALHGAPEMTFVDVTADAGIRFIHDNAASPEKYLIETMGAGAAWLDYDNDGRLDIYLVNSAATKAYTPARPLRGALYRNNGDGTFSDTTLKAGVAAEGVFGMGVAVGDYDNDGDPDLYVVGYDRSILYRNNGDGTFSNVTTKSKVANQGKWGSSAAWFDYDKDGLLDLIVVNYVDWSPARNIACGQPNKGLRAYCSPKEFHGQTPTLYRNNGDGTFIDASVTTKIGIKRGNGLGVVCFDVDGDGWQDVFIANDSMENFLYMNRRGKIFEEVGLPAGVAYGDDGKAEAGMGADAADYDGDGRLDLIVTHLDREYNRLYRNNGDGSFTDSTLTGKLGAHSYQMSGFGVRFLDYDNDGWRDLFIANGHVLDNIPLFHAETAYAERKTVYRNVQGAFSPVSDALGPDILKPTVSRAAAVGDYDNDGDLDILVTNNGQPPQLLRNDSGNRNHWLEVRLAGSRSNRDGVGAKIRLVASGHTQVDEAKGGGSYQSAHDPRIHFGLGAAEQVDVLEVRWPSGTVDQMRSIRSDRVVTVKESRP